MKNNNYAIGTHALQPPTFDLLPLVVSQLLDKVINIERLLEQRISKAKPEGDEVFLVDQAADFLQLSTPTIYAHVSNRKIPFMKKGKRLYFSKKALTEWLEESNRRAIV